jgi:phosphatidylinositol dimannoside acyltransferase
MKYRLWQVASWTLRRLPLRVSYAFASLAGAIAFACWPRGRRATTRNFRVVLGRGVTQRAVRRVARRSLQNYCRYLVDFARFPGLSAGEIHRLVDGGEHFEQLAGLLDETGGVLATCMHFGNWDLGAGATGARGIPATAVAETFGDSRLDEAVLGARRAAGLEIATLGSGAPSMLKALKRGRVLAVVVDRPTHGEGATVTFFGRETQVPAGAARLALRAGVPVIAAAFPRRRRSAPNVTTLTDFTIPVPPADSENQVQDLMQSIFTAHEAIIRRYPSQWYMFREMWPADDGCKR